MTRELIMMPHRSVRGKIVGQAYRTAFDNSSEVRTWINRFTGESISAPIINDDRASRPETVTDDFDFAFLTWPDGSVEPCAHWAEAWVGQGCKLTSKERRALLETEA